VPDDNDEQATPPGRAKRSRRDRLIGAFTTTPRASGDRGAGWSPLSSPPPSADTTPDPPAAAPGPGPGASSAASAPGRADPPRPRTAGGPGAPDGPGGPPGTGRSGGARLAEVGVPGAAPGAYGSGGAGHGAGDATRRPPPSPYGRSGSEPVGGLPAGATAGPMASTPVGTRPGPGRRSNETGTPGGEPGGAAGQWSGTRWELADQPSTGDPTEYIVVGPESTPAEPGEAPPAVDAYPPVFDPMAARAARPASAEAAHVTGPSPAETEAPPIDIVGLHGGQWFGRAAEAALRAADVLIGHARQLAVLPSDPPLPGKPVELWGNLDEVLGFAAEHREAGERACVLAAGDPGFFGLVRLAAARLGDEAIRVHPAPSSVALAFARAGTNWDDALVVSAHGRPLEPAVAAAVDHPKVAVLVSKDQPPQALGQALLDAGCGDRSVVVCSRLGETDEQITRTDLAGLAAGRFDPLSVVLVQAPPGARTTDSGMGLRWGRPEADFAHRDGMVTKAEVRAVALGKLGLPPVGTLWDVGAGSGSVAVECARLAPGLRIYAVERRADDVERIRANALGSGLTIVEGTAPEVLADLPDPDRVFLGGGGLEVLDAALARLRPGGAVVATYATLATAAAAAERLGNIVQVQVSRGVPVGASGRLRLAAENPVFVCWGPA